MAYVASALQVRAPEEDMPDTPRAEQDPHPDQLNNEDRGDPQPADTPERPGSDDVRQELEDEDRFEATDN